MRAIDADALLEHAWDADTRVGYVQVVDVQDIENAPTIEQQRWIPMSERPPKTDEHVLVTTIGYDVRVWRYINICIDMDDSCFWEDENGYYLDKYNVIAWMPLPKPYQNKT